jgi:signal recognition particle subunit SRP19
MKEYDKYVVWLDYFNSELKRKEGRRVPLSSATRAPQVEELTEACRRLNLYPTGQAARYPSSAARESGYVAVNKVKPKQALLVKIAKELTVVRGLSQKKPAQTSSVRKK